jgi:hypothetical protein
VSQHVLLSFPGEGSQITKCCWLAARVLLCSKTDKEVREQLYEATAKDGLLAPKTPPAAAAAAWVRLWLASSELEREALLMLLTSRTRVQVGGGGCVGASKERMDVVDCRLASTAVCVVGGRQVETRPGHSTLSGTSVGF